LQAIARLLAGLKGLRLAGFWAGLAYFGATPTAHGAHLAVVLSDDSAPYQEVYEAIRTRVDDHNITASRIYAGAATDAALNARLVVAVGVRAAESVADFASRSPVLVVLVPKDWYQKTGRQRLTGNAHRAVSALYLDQPYARQAHLISLAFPEVKRVGVLVNAAQAATVHEDIGKALRKEGLTLIAEVLKPDQKLIEPLERIFIKSDLMLAVPDAEVFNHTTAQSILLTSYRYHDPVVGYSYSLMRAGALVSLYSTPGQIGQQAAEIIVKQFESAHGQLPDPAYPRYFSVGVNQQVARSLGLNVLPEAELERRLAGDNDD
jgi:putative ABC transport system substrate-binding protein